MKNIEILGLDLDDMEKYARQICSVLKPGDVLLLEGELGTGKTQLIKFCCLALGYNQLVTSPSYTLANVYNAHTLNLIHADFYRIHNELEFFDIGLEHFIDDSITFIEWGEKFQHYFDNYLKIRLDFVENCENCRKLTLTCEGPDWVEKFQKLQRIFAIKN